MLLIRSALLLAGSVSGPISGGSTWADTLTRPGDIGRRCGADNNREIFGAGAFICAFMAAKAAVSNATSTGTIGGLRVRSGAEGGGSRTRSGEVNRLWGVSGRYLRDRDR